MTVPLSYTRLDMHRRLSALSRKPYGDMEAALAELLAEVDRLRAELAGLREPSHEYPVCQCGDSAYSGGGCPLPGSKQHAHCPKTRPDQLDEWVHCRRPDCLNGEWLKHAEERGWAYLHTDAWLCSDHAAAARETGAGQ